MSVSLYNFLSLTRLFNASSPPIASHTLSSSVHNLPTSFIVCSMLRFLSYSSRLALSRSLFFSFAFSLSSPPNPATLSSRLLHPTSFSSLPVPFSPPRHVFSLVYPHSILELALFSLLFLANPILSCTTSSLFLPSYITFSTCILLSVLLVIVLALFGLARTD